MRGLELGQPLCVPHDDGNARGYRGRDRRLRPLGWKVGRVGEDIANERRNGADRCRPKDAVRGPIHLYEQGNSNNGANNAANRRETCVLKAERGQHVAPCHDEKTGEPGARELFDSGAHKATLAYAIQCLERTIFEAWHILALPTPLPLSAGFRNVAPCAIVSIGSQCQSSKMHGPLTAQAATWVRVEFSAKSSSHCFFSRPVRPTIV